MKNKAMLIILDGYGLNDQVKGNAVAAADRPFIKELFAKYPHSRLKACGRDVGLPDGVMGNSEVGHLNIGGGRVVYQLNTMIDHKIETGEFFTNPALLSAINHAKKNHSKLHFFGLLSPGGVHSSLNHLDALLQLFKKENLQQAYFHAFMDGRDTLPNSGIEYIKEYMAKSEKLGVGKVASVCGRYYAMDRDNRWERVVKAYNMLVFGQGNAATDPVKVMSESYANDVTDEFILPTIITENGKPIALIEDNDAVIFFNFRSDRPREITKAFIYNDFAEFPVKKIKNLKYVTMTEYDAQFGDLVEVAFRLEKLDDILGKVMETHQKTQLRLAETEKYAHVTFFFNGGVEQPFAGEDRILIPSPKIPSYDQQPSMSAFLVKDAAIDTLNTKDYDLIIINFANCDMVGHTGKFSAAVEAVETVDKCLQEIVPLALSKQYNIVITADHGNAEQMLDENGNVMTAHSMNDVPLILLHTTNHNASLSDGKLCDIAPTILQLMDIEKPAKMTGVSLIR
ncbi:MAG: 2,3-bisphosphoglycerate-independent phosphoglycerate mutase [Candidatus Cloacimonetes bacterium]|nr:2,3-bisphosphoglycerate-independent phosphoglycerate mutase [Candidatus Cloacimonadota bacterium]